MDSSGFRSFLGLVKFVFGSERVNKSRPLAQVCVLGKAQLSTVHWGLGDGYKKNVVVVVVVHPPSN